MARFRHIAVLKGGISGEREVSLTSGAAIAKALRGAGYKVDEIDITSRQFDLNPKTDAVFIGLHGEFGEDGQVQHILESREIPYTGAGPQSSQDCFDKKITKERIRQAGLPTPEYYSYKTGSSDQPELGYPVVAKPLRQGSSLGLHLVFNQDDWENATRSIPEGADWIIEKYIAGRELTVGVVGERALPVLEIRAPNDRYDYQAKYTKGITEYLVPAPLDAGVTEKCQELALACYQVMDCRGFARIDFRLDPEDNLFILEINTIPGFTETSLLPKAARAAGVAFQDLCEKILEMATY